MINSNTKSNIVFSRVQLEYLRATYKGILSTKITPALSERDIMYNSGILEVINKVASCTPDDRPNHVRIE